MRKVLVLGAGKSSSTLIKYLQDQVELLEFEIEVADSNPDLAKDKIGNKTGSAIQFNVEDSEQLNSLIKSSSIVISMLPANYHDQVAEVCLQHSKHLITASYVSEKMKSFHKTALEKDLIFLNECGLDPGIDHMSGMKVIDQIRDKGLQIHAFETFTGGLIESTTEDNPWQYKFTWNPRNVVMAGVGGVKFLQEGRFKYIPHHRLFRRFELIHIPGYGYFEGYANRDSLKYREIYALQNIKTMFRGTFRRPGFCKAWNVFVRLGAVDDSYQMEHVESMTHRQFVNSFLSYNPNDSVELKLAHYMNIDLESDEMTKLKWSGFFSEELVGLDSGSPAQILEHILKKKWTLDPGEKDMIVMWHKFNFIEENEMKEVHSTLIAIGDNDYNTAMSKTVGLPLGISAKLILENKLSKRGVLIPTERELYEPILEELKTLGFDFIESQKETVQ